MPEREGGHVGSGVCAEHPLEKSCQEPAHPTLPAARKPDLAEGPQGTSLDRQKMESGRIDGFHACT